MEKGSANCVQIMPAGRALPSAVIAVVNPETETYALPDEVGELWVASDFNPLAFSHADAEARRRLSKAALHCRLPDSPLAFARAYARPDSPILSPLPHPRPPPFRVVPHGSTHPLTAYLTAPSDFVSPHGSSPLTSCLVSSLQSSRTRVLHRPHARWADTIYICVIAPSQRRNRANGLSAE